MTTNVVEYTLPDGTTVTFEVAEEETGSRQRVSRTTNKGFMQAEPGFDEALAHIKPAAEYVLQSFREMQTPDEITLDFGIKFKDTGVVFASSSSDATFRVILKWNNEKRSTAD